MKKSFCILAALLCAVILLALAGCSDDTVTPPSATEVYNQARDILLNAGNRISGYSMTRQRLVNGDTYITEAAGTASFSGIGTDSLDAIVEEALTFGSLTAAYAEYYDGTASCRMGSSVFRAEMTAADFVDRHIPAVLLDAALYGSITAEQNTDGTTITFTQPTDLESWVTGVEDAQLVSASGAAILDTAGTLIESSYQARYLCGPATYILEVVVRVSTPDTLDLSARHAEYPQDGAAITCLDAPKLLMQAAGDILTSHAITCNTAETIYSTQPAPLTQTRQSEFSIHGFGSSLSASATSATSDTDYWGQTVSSSQNITFRNGICSGTGSNGDPAGLDAVTAEAMRTGCEDAILAGLFATAYLADAALTDAGEFYILKLTGNDAYCADLSAQLDMIPDGDAVADTTVAAGYLVLNKNTGLPTAMGMSLSRTQGDDQSPYQMYQLDQSLTLSDIDAYQAAVGETETETAPAETAKPLFYKVTGDNGQQLWLMGTIHVGDNRTAFLPQQVYDALENAAALVVEYDIQAFEEQAATDPALLSQLSAAYFYADGSYTADHLPSELHSQAQQMILASGNEGANTRYMKAVVWNSLLVDFYLQQNYTLSSHKSLDNRLLTLAKSADIPILTMDSGLSQITALTGLSDGVQALLLRQTIEAGCTEYGKSISQLYEMWCRGDETGLTAALLEPDKDLSETDLALYEQYTDQLITQRNASMLSAAAEHMASGKTVFFAIGITHLLGEDGLVNALRTAGYTVEQVSYE